MTTVTNEVDVQRDVRQRQRRALGAAVLVYLSVAVALMWNVLVLSPAHAATCTCSDVSQFAWFIEWPLAAIRHGHNPFFSTAMFAPSGINVLANTSATGLGFLFLPVTALFGPLAALNVGLVVAPVASATAMMFVAQRWTTSRISAGLAGLMYGFSPLVLFHDALGHLNVTFLAVPPLVLWCLDDLFVRRRHSVRRVGIVLGLLLTWQFFIGSEVLLLIVMLSAVGLLVVGVGAVTVDRSSTLAAIRRGGVGLGFAGIVSAVLLVGPVSYSVFGPRHYSGAVWPGRVLSNDSLRSFVTAHGGPGLWFAPSTRHFLPSNYLSPALVLVIVAGVVWCRRDRRVIVAATLLALSLALTLGQRYWFAPWHWLVKVPVLNNVVNDRFSVFIFLFAALIVIRVADKVRATLSARIALVTLVCASALVGSPYIIDAVHVAPYPASAVWIPAWYRDVGAKLAPGHVVLGFPFFNTSANLLAVQALTEMRYSVVGGTTPQWLIRRQGPAQAGYRDLWNAASMSAQPILASRATSRQMSDVAFALNYWHVTDVVLPRSLGPNTSPVARAPNELRSWLSSILGPAHCVDHAWVWTLVPKQQHK